MVQINTVMQACSCIPFTPLPNMQLWEAGQIGRPALVDRSSPDYPLQSEQASLRATFTVGHGVVGDRWRPVSAKKEVPRRGYSVSGGGITPPLCMFWMGKYTVQWSTATTLVSSALT